MNNSFFYIKGYVKDAFKTLCEIERYSMSRVVSKMIEAWIEKKIEEQPSLKKRKAISNYVKNKKAEKEAEKSIQI